MGSRSLVIRVVWATGLAVSAQLLGACVDEKIVFRDRTFPTPPTAAAGFLGYSDQARKTTTCGNCHVESQSKWRETQHANAFASLGTNSQNAACQGCHTVNQRGNTSPDSSGGFVATRDARYHDVQCENCHGPGLEHVENPESTQPFASLAVGVNLTSGCGECHRGFSPFVEEWSKSGHAAVLASPASRAECVGCHTAQGALAAWGITADYIEKNAATPLAMTCGVCHDPHSNRASARAASGGQPATTGGQLRFAVDVPDEGRNLCMKCHHKRAQPDIDPVTRNSRGPHSPEGPLLLGENVGFWFSDTPIDNQRILGTHGSEANPRLCATCHLPKYTVRDALNGSITLQSTGHLFLATPCLNAQGVPTSDTTCAVTARSFKGCTGSGCHGTETAARSALSVVTTRIETLAAQLKALVDRVRATEINANDRKWTSAEGADFNYQLALKKGSAVHNPFMVEALLTASIREMRTRYNLSVSPGLTLENVLGNR